MIYETLGCSTDGHGKLLELQRAHVAFSLSSLARYFNYFRDDASLYEYLGAIL